VRVCPALAEPTALVFATREGLPLDRRNLLRKPREARSEDAWAYRCDVASAEAQLRNDGSMEWTPVGRCNPCSDIPHRKSRARFTLHAIPEEQDALWRMSSGWYFGPKWTQVAELDQSTSGT